MRIPVTLPLLALTLLAGCDRPAPEERLQSAGEQLDSAEESLESLDTRIDELEATLAALRNERRRTEERLLTLEERVAARATDVALFRAVQSAVLEDEPLSQSAIAVDARKGVVTLTGLVPSAELRDRAVQLAADTAGVDRVVSRIDLEPGDGDGGPRAGSSE
jgi:osmotically-inducible protein OsmY